MSATVTTVASSDSTGQILGASANRAGAIIHNNSTAVLYLRFGTADASTSSYTVQLATQTHYEVPFGYQGDIQGIWASVNGDAQVTDIQR